MWRLVNQTPFAAERAFARDKEGRETWIVAVKATYAVKPDGRLKLEDQEKVRMAPEYTKAPGESSLKYESDIVLAKTGTDILINGHAYAKDLKPASQVDVTLRIGGLAKTIRVFGDRYWDKGVLGPVLSRPRPFVRLPLVYERAYGGVIEKTSENGDRVVEWRNPVGAGFGLRAQDLIDKPAPNLEDPRDMISSPEDRPRPAGFGPVAPHWLPRRGYAGAYDEKWRTERRPLLPLDFDDRFYRCAPQDQQLSGFLAKGVLFELYSMTPDGVLRFTPPMADLTFVTHLGGETISHKAVLHTLIIEPDVPRFMMVWQTSLMCQNREHHLEKTVIS